MAYGRVSRSTPPPFRPAAVRLNPAEKADQARIAKVVAEARHRERIERIERMQSLSRSRPGAATGASARSQSAVTENPREVDGHRSVVTLL